MRIQSVIAGTAASVVVVGLGAVAAIIGVFTSAEGSRSGVPVAVAAKPLDRNCVDCGVVVAVRAVDLTSKTNARRYQLQVRMANGSVKTLTYATPPAWKAGDRVRLQNGRVVG